MVRFVLIPLLLWILGRGAYYAPDRYMSETERTKTKQNQRQIGRQVYKQSKQMLKTTLFTERGGRLENHRERGKQGQ